MPTYRGAMNCLFTEQVFTTGSNVSEKSHFGGDDIFNCFTYKIKVRNKINDDRRV